MSICLCNMYVVHVHHVHGAYGSLYIVQNLYQYLAFPRSYRAVLPGPLPPVLTCSCPATDVYLPLNTQIQISLFHKVPNYRFPSSTKCSKTSLQNIQMPGPIGHKETKCTHSKFTRDLAPTECDEHQRFDSQSLHRTSPAVE